MSLFDLTGKIVGHHWILEVGSAGPLHSSCAEHGAKVVISSRKQDACDAVAGTDLNAQIRRGHRTSPSRRTSPSKEALQHLGRREHRAAFGHIDVLVCNAASNPVLRAAIRHQRRSVPQGARQQHRQRTTGLSQMVGARDARATRGFDHYRFIDRGTARIRRSSAPIAISKAADMQLARNLAHEFGPDNVRVNCIAPGLIKTDFAQGAVGGRESACPAQCRDAAEADRRTRGDRGRGAQYLASGASSYHDGCRRSSFDGGVTI